MTPGFLENLWIPGLNDNLRIYDGLSDFSRIEFTKGNDTCDWDNTGWSKSLCAPDDYDTETGAQILFDYIVYDVLGI